jgi:hypothetical protein
MADKDLGQRFAEYRPSKTVWFWSTLACMVLTVIVGFTWGGWVSGGSAKERAETAAESAVAKLAADICAFRFLAAPDVATQLSALKDEASYERDDMIVDGGWVTFAGAKEPVHGAAQLCADHLAEVELPAVATNQASATN